MILCNYGCGKEGKHQLKNGKVCCEKSFQSCSEVRKKNSSSLNSGLYYVRFNPNKMMSVCYFCGKKISIPGKKSHERYCYLNPDNLKLCAMCEKPVKNYRSEITCSHICKNEYLKLDTKPRGSIGHKKICFKQHKKECII